MAIFNIQRTITLTVGKQELRFMCSARRLLVFNICVKFHEKMSSFKVMERTRKLLTDTHTEKTKTIYLIAYFIRRGYNQRYGSCVHVFCMSCHGLTFV